MRTKRTTTHEEEKTNTGTEKPVFEIRAGVYVSKAHPVLADLFIRVLDAMKKKDASI